MDYQKEAQDFENANYGNIDTMLKAFNEDYEKLQDLGEALSGVNVTTLTYSAHEDITLDEDDEINSYYILLSGQDATANLKLPAQAGIYHIRNGGSYPILVDVVGGSSPFPIWAGASVVVLTSESEVQILSIVAYNNPMYDDVAESKALDPFTYSKFRINSSGGGLALSLPDLSVFDIGREIKLYMHTAGNNAVLTPSNFTDGSTLTFDAVGESATLVWSGSAWEIIALSGATIGA